MACFCIYVFFLGLEITRKMLLMPWVKTEKQA